MVAIAAAKLDATANTTSVAPIVHDRMNIGMKKSSIRVLASDSRVRGVKLGDRLVTKVQLVRLATTATYNATASSKNVAAVVPNDLVAGTRVMSTCLLASDIR